MYRSLWMWNWGLILALTSTGCAHLVETKTIEKFATELKKHDLDGLKSSTSDGFANRALRTAESLDDLELLRIPDGKISVVEVEDVTEDHKRVTVAVGEAKKEVFYELTKSHNGKWVVDDIYLKQKKQGVEAYKAVSEQMNLLMTIREFLNAWDSGERSDVLQGTTADLRGALEKLPPNYLAKISKKITTARKMTKKQGPNAQLMDDIAVVRLGVLMMTMELTEDKWLVSDVIIKSKDEADSLPSLYREAIAIDHGIRFLAAYERSDRQVLQSLCTRDFYEGGLSVGNLKEVPLPSSLLLDHDLDINLHGLRADLTLRNDREVVQLTLHREAEDELETVPHYHVSNASIYDLSNQQEMRLGALFTARAMGEFYLEALSKRDLSKLRHSSTGDFSQRVWKKLDDQAMITLPLEPFDGPPGQITKIRFEGSLAQIEAQVGEQHVSLDLREELGKFLVDEIHWEIPGRPTTAKNTLEMIIPVRRFATGLSMGLNPRRQKEALATLQENSSRDFNRLVWTQSEFVPMTELPADTLLNESLKSLTFSEGRVIIQLGDKQHGAIVNLVKEHDAYAIDDIELLGGPLPSDRVAMKRELRTQLSHGLAHAPEGIQQASGNRVLGMKSPTKVVPANFEAKEQNSVQASVPEEFEVPAEAKPIKSWEDFGEVQTEPLNE